MIAKFHRTDLVICSHFRERKSLSYSQINTVTMLYDNMECTVYETASK